MRTIHALIVDDEPPARDELAYLLAGYPDVRTSQARNAAEALDAIRSDAPELVFLDIQMPGRNGFHVLRESLPLRKPPLFIFVTAYDQYAVRAFEGNAVDYLLKPISAERLKVSMDRVRDRLADRADADAVRARLGEMLGAMDQASPLERIMVEKGGRIHLVPARDVYYCETADRKIFVHFKQEALPAHGVTSLDEVRERLKSEPMFRINRNTLVNMTHIREYAPWTGGRYCLVLGDDASTELTLSRGRVQEFKATLGL